jgi:hypothetical protein
MISDIFVMVCVTAVVGVLIGSLVMLILSYFNARNAARRLLAIEAMQRQKVNRGGYKCRHGMIWSKKSKYGDRVGDLVVFMNGGLYFMGFVRDIDSSSQVTIHKIVDVSGLSWADFLEHSPDDYFNIDQTARLMDSQQIKGENSL